MIIVDSCGWLEWFADGSLAGEYKTLCLSGILKLNFKVIISNIGLWIPATRLRGHKLFNENDITSIHYERTNCRHTREGEYPEK